MEVMPEVASPPTPHEVRIDLERMIARLPDDQRLVLVLHDVEGMKHREIAEHLDIPRERPRRNSRARANDCAR